MHDINPLVHQLYLRDLDRRALAIHEEGTDGPDPKHRAAFAIAVAAAVVLGVVLLGGQTAVIAAVLS